jgi:hypothetical protein
LTLLLAITSGALGLVLFFAPGWSAPRFAWKVSPFVTMTIGAWCLGNAWTAAWALAHPRWQESLPMLMYLWIFGLSEAGVALAFRHLVPLGNVLTWPYLIVIGVNVLAAVAGIVDAARTRALDAARQGDRTPGWLEFMIVGFVLFVALLAVVGLLHPASGTTRREFPEVLSSFTIRAFGAFYLSLSLAAAFAAALRRLDPVLTYGGGGWGLALIITVATFVYIGVFDIGDHPLQLVYIGAYVFFLVVAGLVLYRYRDRLRGHRPASAPAGAAVEA